MKHNTWKLLESAVFETLEDREMMSATPLGISLSNGTLSLNDNSTKPTQMVVDYSSDKSELYARIGSVNRYFPTSQVKNINVNTGDGNDYVYINPQLDVDAVISAGNGNDSIHAGGGTAHITAGNGADVIYAAQGDNTIQLGNGDNRVLGAGGNDKITVGNGNNYVYGGSGNDSITAGTGDNTLLGAAGDDVMVAGNGNNLMNGGLGNDVISAGTGRDSLMGYSGNDNISGGGATSVLRGGAGVNTVSGPSLTTPVTGTVVSSGNAGNTSGATSSGTGTANTSGSTSTGSTAPTQNTTGGTTTTNTGSTGTTGTGTTTSGGSTTSTGTTTAGTGGTVQAPTVNPNAKAPTPIMNVLDGTRQVGLGINVDALQSKLASGTAITTNYQWDFGDPGTSFNQMTGFTASHVYDKTGTYTIKLTVTDQDGGSASVTQSVTVTASTRNQVFVDSVHGSDSNPGTQNAPIKTLDQANKMIKDNTELLLRAGEKFDVDNTLSVNAKNVLIGSYGAGASPILNRLKENGSHTISTYGNSNGVTIQNITFDSPFGVGANDQAPKTGVSGIEVGGQNIVIRNCTFLNIDDAINENYNPTGVLIQNNNAPLTTGVRGYFVWGQGSRSVIVGNNVANSTREHNIRMVDMTEVTVEGNTLANLNRQNVDPNDYSKGGIEMHRGSYAFIADNNMIDGDIRLGPLGLWGESPTTSTDWSVIEDNDITGTQIFLNSGTHHAMVEGNVIHTDNSEAIEVSGMDSSGRESEDITLVNNTAVDNGTSGNFMRLEGAVNGMTVKNNLWVAPTVAASSNAIRVNANDLNSFTSITGNVWPAQVGNATNLGQENASQWNAESKVGTDVFKTVTLSDTYQTTVGSLVAGSQLLRAA